MGNTEYLSGHKDILVRVSEFLEVVLPGYTDASEVGERFL